MIRNLMFSVMAILAVSFPFSVKAEGRSVRGEKTLGIMGGYGSYNHSGFASVYFQYTFAPHFRIVPEVGCVFRNDDKSALVISADMHFPFRMAKGFNIYPLAGLTFNNWNYTGGDNILRVGGDFGAGLDLYFTQNFKLTVQGKYSVMKDTSGAYAGIGFGYTF